MSRNVKVPMVFCLVGVLACALTVTEVANACSRILWNTNEQAVIVARSSDWIQAMGEMLVIYPRGIKVQGDAGENSLEWISKYGGIGVVTYGLTLKNVKRSDGTRQDPLVDWDLDGMNEKGLAAHLLYLPGTKYEKEDKRPGIIYSRWARYVLDNFDTVTDAVCAIRNVSVPFGALTPAGPVPTMSTWWTTASDLNDRVFYFHWTSNLNVLRIDLKKLNFSAERRMKALDPKRTDLVDDIIEKFVAVSLQN